MAKKKQMNENRKCHKRGQELFHTSEYHDLNVNLYLFLVKPFIFTSRAGLTIVAIATGHTVLRVTFVRYYMQGWIPEFRCPRQTLRKGALFYTCYPETSFAESKLNFSFCLGSYFCVKFHFTVYIV